MSGIISVADVSTSMVEDAAQQLAQANETAAVFTTIAADITSLAEFLRANPDLAQHVRGERFRYNNRVLAYISGDTAAATIAQFARAALRAGRKVTKKPGAEFFGIEVSFGWPVLYVYADRDQVCERVVTGVETVTREVPDPEALAAVPTVTVTEEVEQVEWRCGPLLGAGQTGGES